MKIHRSNQVPLNAYHNYMQKYQKPKESVRKQDRLQISEEAKRLQSDEKMDTKRSAYVHHIKEQIKQGTYEIDYEKTAQKMIDFWTNQI